MQRECEKLLPPARQLPVNTALSSCCSFDISTDVEVRVKDSLCDLEDSQQTQSSKHADAEGGSRPEETPQNLEDAADNHLQTNTRPSESAALHTVKYGSKQLTTDN